MFAFVTVSHPDEIKDRKKQGKLRQHAIRNGIQRSKAERAKKDGIFVSVEIGEKGRQAHKRASPKSTALTKAPSVSLLDPFNTLSGCPERLRSLMQHHSAGHIREPSSEPFFRGMETIFKGALADPSLFHALSLVLSLATNIRLPNVEVLTHRGELLNGIRTNIKALEGTPKVSTMTAMLILIGYEYRIDGANCNSIAHHIRGVQSIMKIRKTQNVALVDEVQRALFWQDLLSCIMSRTPRFLSHKDFHDFQSPRDVLRIDQKQVPYGFQSRVAQWSDEFAAVLQDLNALCFLIDSQCGLDEKPLDVFPVDHNQANIESRLVDLLSQCRQSPSTDPWYEACILCAYICTYKLSTGIWVGCFIPEMCVDQICRILEQSLSEQASTQQWSFNADMLSWLLFVMGGLIDHKELRERVGRLIRSFFIGPSNETNHHWEVLKETLRDFVWCEHSMAHKVFQFWQEVYPEHTVIVTET